MAAGTVVTAAGAAVLLYYILARTIKGGRIGDMSSAVDVGKRKMARRPAQAPATWLETLTTLSETLRFTYAETLGKWPIADLAFGVNYLMRRHGNVELTAVYGGSNCTRLSGLEIVSELKYFVRLLTICIFFSKRPFPAFLELSGYSKDDVLVHKPKAGILKPAFTVIRDKETKRFLLLIRGTHSIKDTLTAATGAVVPFHHSVLNDGGVSNLVLGYAHCGMVAAARWIAKLSSPFLLKALEQYPDYSIKVVGHSLGGGTAALLTYILREQKEFSSSVCVTFAPAACMTWELAESGKHFITTVINGADLVPTFSSASVDDLRCEVTASSWLSDLRDQVERTRVLNVVYRSATALGSRLPSVRERVAGAGAVIKRAQDVVAKTRPVLSSWSCIGPRRRPVVPVDGEAAQEGGSEVEALVCREGGEEVEEALWSELEKELKRDGDEGEDEIIIEEESMVVVEEERLDEISENQRFYPPGRILHVVSSSGEDGAGSEEGHVALYETPRELYGKIRFSRRMIHDHYMPVYKKVIECLIRELEKEDENEVLVL